MPALPPVLGTAKIIVKQSLAGVPMYNVLHAFMNQLTNVPQEELDALAAAVRAAWVTNVLPLQANTVLLTDVQVIDLTNDVGNGSVATGSNAGTGSGSANPANVCVCWSWKIRRRYRGGHPRTYIGGIPNTANSNANTITSTARTAHSTAAAAIRTAVNAVSANGGNVRLGAVSYYQNKVIRPQGIVDEFTGVSVDDRFDSQRRRLGRDR